MNMILPLSISVALATYNGEKYIEAQLDSIFAQTLRPNEVVICDDRSSDKTVEKLLAYQQKYPAVIQVKCNPTNLGFIRNFEQAISLCQGDIIFFCDQDDVWLPNKVERIVKLFADDPECGFVFSDAEVTDEFLQPKGSTVYETYIKPDLRPGKTLSTFIRRIYLLGCTSAFRAKYRPYLLPFSTTWGHDHWTAFILTVISSIRMIDEPLMYYRRHTSNAGNVGAWNRNFIAVLKRKYKALFSKNYEPESRKWNDMLQQLLRLQEIDAPPFSKMALAEAIAAVTARRDFEAARLALIKRSRLTRFPSALRLFKKGGYSKYLRGPRSLFKDLIT